MILRLFSIFIRPKIFCVQYFYGQLEWNIFLINMSCSTYVVGIKIHERKWILSRVIMHLRKKNSNKTYKQRSGILRMNIQPQFVNLIKCLFFLCPSYTNSFVLVFIFLVEIAIVRLNTKFSLFQLQTKIHFNTLSNYIYIFKSLIHCVGERIPLLRNCI